MQTRGCPLKADTNNPYCGENCGWFDVVHNCCAVLVIGNELEALSDTFKDLLEEKAEAAEKP